MEIEKNKCFYKPIETIVQILDGSGVEEEKKEEQNACKHLPGRAPSSYFNPAGVGARVCARQLPG